MVFIVEAVAVFVDAAAITVVVVHRVAVTVLVDTVATLQIVDVAVCVIVCVGIERHWHADERMLEKDLKQDGTAFAVLLLRRAATVHWVTVL